MSAGGCRTTLATMIIITDTSADQRHRRAFPQDLLDEFYRVAFREPIRLSKLWTLHPAPYVVFRHTARNPVSAAPVAPPLKSKPTESRAEFARMTVAAPTAPKRYLQGRERQTFALHLNWVRRQRRASGPALIRRQAVPLHSRSLAIYGKAQFIGEALPPNSGLVEGATPHLPPLHT